MFFNVFYYFFLRPGSTVHCTCGFFPPKNPGQNPGRQKSGKQSGPISSGNVSKLCTECFFPPGQFHPKGKINCAHKLVQGPFQRS